MSVESVLRSSRVRQRRPANLHIDVAALGHARVDHRLKPWQRRHRVRTISLDLAVLVAASGTALALRAAVPGVSNVWGGTDEHLLWATMVALPLVWLAMLARTGAYATRFVGVGADEYRAVGQAAVLLVAGVAFLSYAFKLEVSRGFMLFLTPLLLVGTLAGRWVLRAQMAQARHRGEQLQDAVVVGNARSVLAMVERIESNPATTGLRVAGVCITDLESPIADHPRLHDVPVVGVDKTIQAVDMLGGDVVAMASTDLSAVEMRRIGWSLEQRGVDLLVSPGVLEVAGPRLSLRRAEALPMLHVERPVTYGARLLVKNVLDRVVAAAILVALSPVLLALAIIVRRDSPGKAFFLQERVGEGGRVFTMFKFRTMVDDAEQRRLGMAGPHDGNETLFKLKRDPRITRVGHILRKYSVDEIPQLINVVRGEMSLIGPRPPLKREVDTYETDVVRRLRVRPGMTGLWQVSGRSDLSWDDSVRLDLWYVDNWSLMVDAQIVLRTFRAVAAGKGAY